MVDNISMVADISIPSALIGVENNPFYWMGILFKPVYIKGDEIYVIKYAGDYKGLRFVYQNDKLTISNSLHKFYKGNNYSDFTYSDLDQSIREIENLTGIEAKKFQVNSMEFGLNVILNTSVVEVIKSFRSYKLKFPFWPMTNNNRIYGQKCVLTEYELKLYDKSVQVKLKDRVLLNENILRFEIDYKRNRTIPEIAILEDLRDAKKLEVLVTRAKDYFYHIAMDGINDFTKINSRQRELYYAGKIPEFWITEYEFNKDHGKEKKDNYREICKTILVKNCKKEIIEAIDKKFIELLGG